MTAFMGYFEADKGKVGFYTDIVWTKLGFDKSHGVLSQSAARRADQRHDQRRTHLDSMTIVEAGGLYEMAHWQGSPGSFTALDGLLGFRYWNNSADLEPRHRSARSTVALSLLGRTRARPELRDRPQQQPRLGRSGDRPAAAPPVHAQPGHAWCAATSAASASRVSFAWQAVAVYSYAWQFSGYALGGLVGYRALGVSYTNGSGINTAGIDAVMHGPLIGFNIRF